MKRFIRVLSLCIVLLLCLPLQALAAIVFDGNVQPAEWFDYPAQAKTFGGPDWFGITDVAVRFAVQPAQNRVIFGFTAAAPGIAADSSVGAAFFLGDREIARWQRQQGVDTNTNYDNGNYDLRGLAYIPEGSANGGFTFEISLVYKSDDALRALRNLGVKLFDPQERSPGILNTHGQELAFSRPHLTDYMKITILAVYRDGAVDYDTCISEIVPLA